MISEIVLTLVLGSSPATQRSAQPLVSATGTAYLSCTTWTGKAWTAPTGRSARTPIMVSPKGFRAYAEVKVVASDGSCENTTTIYVASRAGRKFKAIYSKTGGGNGIRLIGWSPTGEKLLAEVNTWEYETDTGYTHIPVLYDASTDSAKEILELNQALLRHFGTNCDFDDSLRSWRNGEQVLVKISRPTEDDSYEQHFCVEHSSLFVFDLRDKSLHLYERPQTK